MINLNLVIKSEMDFEHYFEILCNLIKLNEEPTQDQQLWEIDEIEKCRLIELASPILEIFRTLVQRRLTVPQIVY